RAVVLCDGEALTPADFPQIAQAMGMPPEIARSGAAGAGASNGAHAANGNGISVLDAGGGLRRLSDVEGDMIRLALQKYRGQMSEVARRLGIGRSTLYRKVRDLGLDG